jgi:hypothetical protein
VWRTAQLKRAPPGIEAVFLRGVDDWAHTGTTLADVCMRRIQMLYTLGVLLLIAWLLGVVGTYTIGAFVHVLLVVALVLFVLGLMTGRRTLA